MGGYDRIKKPKYSNPDWDYICFTNNKKLKIQDNFCKVIYVYDKDLDDSRLSKKIKINFHKYVNDYDLSIYLDGSMRVLGNLDEFVNDFLPLGEDCYDMSISKHPYRKCAYSEAESCKGAKLDSEIVINNQMQKYKKDGFPSDYGLVCAGVIIRRHNVKTIERFCELWWNEVRDHSKRDQLSFNYSFWKSGVTNIKFIKAGIMNGKKTKYIKRGKHKYGKSKK